MAPSVAGSVDSRCSPGPETTAPVLDQELHSSDYVYWPGDLLPDECPRARILAWGYDTVVTKKMAAPSNKSGILSHAKDLLFSLGRERPINRPIVLVAHSLGGIVAKEVCEEIKRSLKCTERFLQCNLVLFGRREGFPLSMQGPICVAKGPYLRHEWS